ncbi:uncharacterized protein LOC122633507 [Vespula pensylvanica]|uniref:uncharacterized protein LOC122633507 n=1 Tax=Vespula pensylvanica TaxID=30213 RepID=UPI001CBA2389|nr:uncharacterized protein LOC122633507 [Vespula pensylvanica]
MFIKGVKNIIRYSFVAMFSTDVNHERNNQSIFEEQQAKLQKIQELTNMLKDTNENLTICEEILTTYLRKRLKAKNEEIKRRNMLENKMTEILENLKTRLLIE